MIGRTEDGGRGHTAKVELLENYPPRFAEQHGSGHVVTAASWGTACFLVPTEQGLDRMELEQSESTAQLLKLQVCRPSEKVISTQPLLLHSTLTLRDVEATEE